MKRFKLMLGAYLIFVAVAAVYYSNQIEEDPQVIHYEKIIPHTEEENIIEVKARETAQEIVRTHEVNTMLQEDRELLCKVAMAEGGNQGEDGMWLIMSVIMNRVEDPDYPDSIPEVIYQKFQFTSILDGRAEKIEPSEECMRAAQRIESGDIAPEIIGFETTDSDVLNQYFTPAFDYRDHRFFTKKK